MSSRFKLRLPLSPTELHTLLVLADRDLYGYAILKAMDAESLGQVRPDIGSLYRSLARLESAGMVGIVSTPAEAVQAPGKTRRYYRLTSPGRRLLGSEISRLRAVVKLADGRLEPQAPQEALQ